MEHQSELPVYNYIYDANNLTWGKYMHLVRRGLHQPLDKAFWYYSYVIISSKSLFNIANTILHTIPGHIMDMIALVTGQKRLYVFQAFAFESQFIKENDSMSGMWRAIKNWAVSSRWCPTLVCVNGNIRTQTSINCRQYCIINIATDTMRKMCSPSNTISIGQICRRQIRNILISNSTCEPSIGMNTSTIICRASKNIFSRRN